ncbi:MAG: MaoC family dehydratase [Deltaproteobacteria bacterium]|nr:MaoC family dehydratase [Deltaproteobacteria bacterium]
MYKVGDAAEMTKVINEEDVFLFAGITGDRNPIHISKEYAAKTRFGERIAHGILTAGLLSAVIGMKLPGPGCLYVSQTLSFLRPVKIGDEVTARIEVAEVVSERRLRLRTQCFNQRKEMVLDGEAVIVPPRRRGAGEETKKEEGQ